MIIVCKRTNGRHDKSRICNKVYKKNEHRWYETSSLTCRVCGGKMIPAEEVEMTLIDSSEALNMQFGELWDQLVKEVKMMDEITIVGTVLWIGLLTVSIQLLGDMAVGASAAVIFLYCLMAIWAKKDQDRRKA